MTGRAQDTEHTKVVDPTAAWSREAARAIDSGSPRSRRALLASALGAGAATIASAIGRPLPARAGVDGDVVLGSQNVTTTSTVVKNNGSGIGLYGVYGASPVEPLEKAAVAGLTSDDSAIGVWGRSTGTGIGVRGSALGEDTGQPLATFDMIGVHGHAPSGRGVVGTSHENTGVHGESTSGYGVRADSDWGTALYARASHGTAVDAHSNAPASPAVAVLGHSARNTGVFGISQNSLTLPAAPAKTGVYGYGAVDATARGVSGETTAGHGVDGRATTGVGVYASATTGLGVYASATTGYALQAKGRVKLDNCSGLATIAKGTKSVVVTPGIDLTTSSAVVATLQASAGGTTTVHRCFVDGPANTFTIDLTANSIVNVKVAWHVFG